MADKHQAVCNGGASQRVLVWEASFYKFYVKPWRKDEGRIAEIGTADGTDANKGGQEKSAPRHL